MSEYNLDAMLGFIAGVGFYSFTLCFIHKFKSREKLGDIYGALGIFFTIIFSILRRVLL
jgi:hypothetical protein